MVETRLVGRTSELVVPVTEALVESGLREGRETSFTIKTGSMNPMLVAGDKVLVRSKLAETTAIGDILLRKAENGWLVHRLICKRTDSETVWLKTKGDNSPLAEEDWRGSDLLGVIAAAQSGKRAASLDSTRARWANTVIARLSSIEADLHRNPSGFVRWFEGKLLRISMRAAGRIARFSIGLG